MAAGPDCRRPFLAAASCQEWDADNRDQQPCKRSGNRRKDGSVRCFGDTKVPVKGLHDLYSSVAQQDDGCSLADIRLATAATIILLCNTAVQIMQTFDWHLGVAETADASILASIAGPFAWLLVPIVGVHSCSCQLPWNGRRQSGPAAMQTVRQSTQGWKRPLFRRHQGASQRSA